MKYKRFEELPVWQDALSWRCGFYELTARRNSEATTVSRNQLGRAGVSVSK